MMRHRRWFRPVCRLLLLALLLQAGAVAAHACDGLRTLARGDAMAMDCTHPGQPAPMDTLCAQHCHPTDSHTAVAIDLHIPPVLPNAFASGILIRPTPGVFHAEPRPIRGGEPPLRTRYCSLLI